MKGVIAAGGPETAAAGTTILEQGGNAVDAAVAATFASFIAEIGVVHLGGSGVAHLYNPKSGNSLVYDFFSNMPGLGTTEVGSMDFSEVLIDFDATTQSFYLGRASVAVPGNIAGLCQMASDYGRLPLATLLEPAIQLARDGMRIEPFQAETCALLKPLYTNTAGMREIFLKDGRMIRPGEQLNIPHLADTLTALAEEGESLARNGRLAQAILTDQQAQGGLLTAADLETYQVHKVQSIRLNYHDYEILLPPPSSIGGVLTALTLKLLACFNVGRLQHGSTSHLRLLFEVMAATTRARLHWDKWSDEIPADEAVERFLSDTFVQTYYQEIKDSLNSRQPSEAIPEMPRHNSTSHISVVDSDGLAVSLTNTAGESAGYVVPGTGFIPNNMLGEIDLHPNGFHKRPAGKRIPTIMTPTIVLHNGQTRLVVGSGGSIRIRSAIFQVLSNLLDFSLPLHDAVNTARVHIEDGVLQCEAGFDPTAVNELEAFGYPVNRWQKRSIYFGGAHSVSRTDNGRLVAAGDNRRGGSVATAAD